jgi:hypothetical protein
MSMSATDDTVNMAEIERRLEAVEPAAFLVPERILRRVIKYHRHPVSFGLRVPHHTSYVVDRRALLEIVEPAELPVNGRAFPETAILILRPEAEDLNPGSLPGTLFRCWRLLFHARVHLALEQRIADGKLTSAAIGKRIGCLGRTEFEEARQVLGQEHLLLSPGDEQSTFLEFAALYLELRHFAPALVPRYFPSLGDEQRIDALLAEDIDAPGLLADTRLEGAPDLPTRSERARLIEADAQGPLSESNAPVPSTIDPDTLVLQANRLGALGNVVRAAILRTQAAARFSAEHADGLARAARLDLFRLVQRLQDALGFPDLEAVQWRQVLPVLLPRAARGFWTAEARFLYDLQKVCIDQEREIYSVDLVKWAVALGRLPLKRPLPGHREVLMVKHLRNAARMLVSVRMDDSDRTCLSQLLAAMVRRGATRLRDYFRPKIEKALDDVRLSPSNVPEEVARSKLIEELLDKITDRGFLNMSDLRDALSRNQLKLTDLAGPGEFFWGDKLILLNRRLTVALDGVYHPGEIYLRWLQRLSSVAFGNRVGRFLTRYFGLPFGGAFVLVEGIGHLWGIIYKVFRGFGAAHAAAAAEHKSFATPGAVVLVGCFLLGMLYMPPFRRGVLHGLALVGRALRVVFVDVPAWIARSPIARPIWLLLKSLLKPLLPAAIAGEVGLLAGLDLAVTAGLSSAVFLAAVLILISHWGRDLQEWCADWVVRGWQRISSNLVPGLFRFIIDVFKGILDRFDRLTYSVNEWTHFKAGERAFMLPVKIVVGLVWSLIMYVIRFAVNLLIEPQINPIKHFPVVTVSHKLILPLAIPPGHGQASPLAEPLTAVFPLTVGKANAIAASVVWGIPGIFGFLVWELKENWRLYRANRSPELQPVMVGSHGETVPRLLRPGFHSGTIPKLFARLRRAERRGRRRAARRGLNALHHVEERIIHFTERELIHLLERSPGWGALTLEVAHVSLATNRIRIAIGRPDVRRDGRHQTLDILFDQSSGQILAHLIQTPWLEELSAAQKTVLGSALAGFFKLAGVDVLETIPSCLCDQKPADGAHFRGTPITWQHWVQIWQDDRSGQPMPNLLRLC